MSNKTETKEFTITKIEGQDLFGQRPIVSYERTTAELIHEPSPRFSSVSESVVRIDGYVYVFEGFETRRDAKDVVVLCLNDVFTTQENDGHESATGFLYAYTDIPAEVEGSERKRSKDINTVKA